MFSTHKYPKAVLGSSGSHLYPRKVRTNLQVLEADIRPPYWVSWRSGNEQDDRDLITSLSLSSPCFPLESPPICSCIALINFHDTLLISLVSSASERSPGERMIPCPHSFCFVPVKLLPTC